MVAGAVGTPMIIRAAQMFSLYGRPLRWVVIEGWRSLIKRRGEGSEIAGGIMSKGKDEASLIKASMD
jgi:hypothetical protein